MADLGDEENKFQAHRHFEQAKQAEIARLRYCHGGDKCEFVFIWSVFRTEYECHILRKDAEIQQMKPEVR